MSINQTIARVVTRYPNLSAFAYVALVSAAFLIVLGGAAQIAQRYDALSATQEMLARLHARSAPHFARSDGHKAAAEASPFLAGSTVTVASAGLLQRVAGIITAAGGTISSSEVIPRGAQPSDGYVKVTVSCELEQYKLQQLLYDIEAGMPFLFIDQLVAQGPAPENPRMRVVIEVSGVWTGTQ
jgi:general secretion pathway protein M